MRGRDNQRSRCYAWERAANPAITTGEFDTVEECGEWLKPIWRAERGRVGRAKVPMPNVESSHWGQRRALAHHDHRITLPRWARNRWVILHEAAHRLTPRDEAHGPRFVGVLIGLVARHLDYDADKLIALADEMGLRYHVRSIGLVPIRSKPALLLHHIMQHGPRTELALARAIGGTRLQVRAAAMTLIRRNEARWAWGKLRLPHVQPSQSI